ASAVCTFEVGEDDLVIVVLHLGVEAADAFVVKPQHVAFLAADGHRGVEVAEDPPLVNPFQHLKGHCRHCNPPAAPLPPRALTEIDRPVALGRGTAKQPWTLGRAPRRLFVHTLPPVSCQGTSSPFSLYCQLLNCKCQSSCRARAGPDGPPAGDGTR